jgi:hypothetical protein
MRDKPVQVDSEFHWPFILAWVCCVIIYFLQYAPRSAPGVMILELTPSFGLSALRVSSLIGLYYYTYSTFAILSGACFDRYGAKYVVPAGIGIGARVAAAAAMIPYTIIKEVNADEVKGSATGAINFLVFTLSALTAPVYGWVLVAVSNGRLPDLSIFQKAGMIGVGGIVLAIILSCFIRETGTAVPGHKTSGGFRLLVAPVLGEAK